jgi:DNA-binding MltR family transcriptional regulator
MGPLNNFAGKIEIAFMFELIDGEVHADLRRIKTIRNAFAHTTSYVYFESEHIAKHCQELSNWKSGVDNQTCFRERAIECINAMKAKINHLMMVHALKEVPSISVDYDQ